MYLPCLKGRIALIAVPADVRIETYVCGKPWKQIINDTNMAGQVLSRSKSLMTRKEYLASLKRLIKKELYEC